MAIMGLTEENAVKMAMVISGISRMHYKLCSQRLEALGIGVGQVPVFMVLVHHNEPVMQHEIAEYVHVTPATVSGTLKRMERDGLVVRTADPRDARISRVTLSEKGRELSREAFSCFSNSSYDMFKGFSSEELEQFDAMVQRITDNLAGELQEEDG